MSDDYWLWMFCWFWIWALSIHEKKFLFPTTLSAIWIVFVQNLNEKGIIMFHINYILQEKNKTISNTFDQKK